MSVLSTSPQHGGRFIALLVLCLTLLWTSLGHHRYFLTGDAGINFRAYATLDRDYFSANREAWIQRRAGDSPDVIHHVRIIEAGYPVLLLLASQLSDRLPFLVNPILLWLLLLVFAFCIALIDGKPRRNEYAALLGILLLLGYSTMARHVWALALPFRDTLSHMLGFGALAILLASDTWAKHRWAWILLAGVLVGLSGWARLSGFLFIVPAILAVLCSLSGDRWARRITLLLWLGSGMLLGLALLIAQNVFEGRHFANVPQADALFSPREAPITDGPQERGQIRQGWHPSNASIILPRLLNRVWHVYPVPLSIIALMGIIGWMFSAKQKAVRLIPMFAGMAIFMLFYGCYDKVVDRYALIIVFFTTTLLALGMGWLLDALMRVIYIRGARFGQLSHFAVAVALIVGIGMAAFRSEPNWAAAQGEWDDAKRFRAWAQQYLPKDAALLTLSPGLLTWGMTFGGPQSQWLLTPRGAAVTDQSTIFLPEGTPLVMSTLTTYPDQDDHGWVMDALLNRFILEPLGPALRFNAIRHQGVRLLLAREPDARSMSLTVEKQAPHPDRLYLYLRDTHLSGSGIGVTIEHASWPRAWEVTLLPGANVLMLPDELIPEPNQLLLTSADPLPSIMIAQWRDAEPIRVHFADYHRLPSHLLHLDNIMVHWEGYRQWWRDFAAFSSRYQATPRILVQPETKLRMPHLVGVAHPQGVLRLYYSAGANQLHELDALHRMNYRLGDESVIPISVLYNRTYSVSRFAYVSDFMHELPWIAGAEIQPDIDLRKEDGTKLPLILHSMEFVVDNNHQLPPREEPVVIGWSWRNRPVDRWMIDGWSHYPWSGFEERIRMQQYAESVSADKVVVADGYYAGLWAAYGGGRPIGVQARWNADPDGLLEIDRLITGWLNKGLGVYVLDESWPVGRHDGSLRLISQLYNLEGQPPLFRVSPWTDRIVQSEVSMGAADSFILRVDVKQIWRPEIQRTFARLTLNGVSIADQLTNGVNYFYIQGDEATRELTVALESDGPVPAELDVAVLPYADSIDMQVSPLAVPPHSGRLVAANRELGDDPSRSVRVSGHWHLIVPAVWPAGNYGVLVEIRWLQDDAMVWDGEVLVEVNGHTVDHESYSDRGVYGVSWVMPAQDRDALVTLTWANADTTGKRVIELEGLRVRPVPYAEPRIFRIGVADDAPFIEGGFYGRERYHHGTPFRWTSAHALLRLYEPYDVEGDRLRLIYHDPRPEGLTEVDLQVRLNDIPLQGSDVGESDVPPFRVWEASVPADSWLTGINRLNMESTTWSPADLGSSRDARALGVMLHRVDVIPHTQMGSGHAPH